MTQAMADRAPDQVDTSLRPDSDGALADVVRRAAAARTTIEIVGGGSKRDLAGPVATTTRIALDGLSGIVAYESAELVLTARPGTPLRTITALLGEHGQMLAFEPPDWTDLLGTTGTTPTLGGTVACNASGPRRIRAGACRDHMLGVAAISGAGTVFKGGGKVVKNVTGYDLPKLLAGSFGTLAIMTELTIKVLPRPEAAYTVVLFGLDDRAAIAALRDAAATPFEPSGLAHLPKPAAARHGFDRAATLIRLEGTAATLAHRHDGLVARLSSPAPNATLDQAETAALWRAVSAVAPFLANAGTIWRASVAPASGPAFVEQVGADDHFYDWAGGLVWLGFAAPADDTDDAATRITAAIEAAGGGHAIIFRTHAGTIPRLRTVPQQPHALAALSRRVKAAFDPFGILNPGRLHPAA
jgi:glycolate oxidase FAD binding subunit